MKKHQVSDVRQKQPLRSCFFQLKPFLAQPSLTFQQLESNRKTLSSWEATDFPFGVFVANCCSKNIYRILLCVSNLHCTVFSWSTGHALKGSASVCFYWWESRSSVLFYLGCLPVHHKEPSYLTLFVPRKQIHFFLALPHSDLAPPPAHMRISPAIFFQSQSKELLKSIITHYIIWHQFTTSSTPRAILPANKKIPLVLYNLKHSKFCCGVWVYYLWLLCVNWCLHASYSSETTDLTH